MNRRIKKKLNKRQHYLRYKNYNPQSPKVVMSEIDFAYFDKSNEFTITKFSVNIDNLIKTIGIET